jgi:hypothetical protein
MSFIKYYEKKAFNLPSLIDIVFLLLVFSLVTQPVSKAKDDVESPSSSQNAVDLPMVLRNTSVKVDERLSTLMFEIVYREPRNPRSARVVTVLKPLPGDSLTYEQAKRRALADSTIAVFPDSFLVMNEGVFENTAACRLIRREIAEYKNEHFFRPAFTNTVEIRAEKYVEFRIIQYILGRCSAYGDTIPRVVLRTFSGREGSRGL